MNPEPKTENREPRTDKDAIVVQDLTRKFGAFVAVDRVSFSVRPGEIFGFLGANGAGKSTTIPMLCGLLRPTSGSALVLGTDVEKDPEGVKGKIGYMSQRFSPYDALTVAQNLRFFGGVYGRRGGAAREREALIGRVFQDPYKGTCPSMTVAENLRMAELRGLRRGLRIGLDAECRARYHDLWPACGCGWRTGSTP